MRQIFSPPPAQPEKQQFFTLEFLQDEEPVFNTIVKMFENTVSQTKRVLELISKKAVGARNVRVQQFLRTANITYQRAAQVSSLLRFAHSKNVTFWNAAETALKNAMELLKQSQVLYNVERIGSWRNQVTAYPFTYLWTATSGYFFYRDREQLKNMTLESYSPCLMNIITPSEVKIGDKWNEMSEIIRELIDKEGFEWIGHCIAAPSGPPSPPPN